MALQQIKLGDIFTMRRPASGEKEFEVLNFHKVEFDFLTCTIENSTSFAPPDVFVTDKEAGRIKLKGFSQVPQTMSLEICVQGAKATKLVTEEKRVLLSDETLAAAKEAPKKALFAGWTTLKRYFFAFCAFSIILYAVKGTAIGDFINRAWAWFNAAKVVEVASDFDPRIATNKHSVYQSSEFLFAAASYKEMFQDSKKTLPELYNFVGDRHNDKNQPIGFFVMKDVVLDKEGHPLLMKKGNAADHCELMGGLLLERGDLIYLAQQYAGVDNFFWPIKRRSYLPEWTADGHSSIPFFKTSWLFLKEDGENPTDEKPVNMLVAVRNSQKHAFRCVFSESLYRRIK